MPNVNTHMCMNATVEHRINVTMQLMGETEKDEAEQQHKAENIYYQTMFSQREAKRNSKMLPQQT